MRPQPLLCVLDVEASSRWFQQVLGLVSDHGGPDYERLLSPDGRLVLQLHHFRTAHDHGPIGDPAIRPWGNGVLVWFEVDDFDACHARALAMNVDVVLPKHRNPPDGKGGPNHWEIWIRDPNGYVVVIASPDGSAAG
jgi:catechol 2,3-dioxygenase-like lactoylglutathione lyase family enzyme